MIAVVDTSALCYLIWIQEEELLPKFFDQILLTPAVFQELSHPKAPSVVRQWLQEPRSWLRIWDQTIEEVEDLSVLDPGEREVLALGKQLGASVVLDERAARAKAQEIGLPVIGILGILALGAEKNLVDLPSAVERLRKTSFHVSPSFLRRFLETKETS